MSEQRTIMGLMALVDDYADHFADSRSAGLTVADAIVLSGKKREILYYASLLTDSQEPLMFKGVDVTKVCPHIVVESAEPSLEEIVRRYYARSFAEPVALDAVCNTYWFRLMVEIMDKTAPKEDPSCVE